MLVRLGTSNYGDDEYYKVQKEIGVYAYLMVPDENFVGFTILSIQWRFVGYKSSNTL